MIRISGSTSLPVPSSFDLFVRGYSRHFHPLGTNDPLWLLARKTGDKTGVMWEARKKRRGHPHVTWDEKEF
jgi:hypothetical protein